MEVGDLVTLSNKALQLNWIVDSLKINPRRIWHKPNNLKFGVVVQVDKVGSKSYYHVQWFFYDGTPKRNYRLERGHLKQFK